MSIAETVVQSDGAAVALAVVNAAQLVLLAWIASRSNRRRRGDR